MFTAMQSVTCPYCWESIEVILDLSEPSQEYIEDCQVCCRPIVIAYVAEGSKVLSLTARAESE
jgi:hypothetical protein